MNISASPFHVGKDREREEMLVTRARDNSCFVAFCNAVGGQDELIFDGHSVVLDDEGEVLARAPGFEEALLVVDVEPEAVIGRRLRDVRRRALARERERAAARVGRPRRRAARARRTARTCTARSRRCSSRARADAARARARPARLRRQERLQRRRARRLGRDRLGARRDARGRRRSGRSACTASRCRRATRPRERAADARRLAENLGCDFRELPIEPIVDAFDAGARAGVRRTRARSHRGEPPGARSAACC